MFNRESLKALGTLLVEEQSTFYLKLKSGFVRRENPSLYYKAIPGIRRSLRRLSCLH